MNDTEAIDAIAALLSVPEWDADTIDGINDVVRLVRTLAPVPPMRVLVSAGHHEYDIDPLPRLTITQVWPVEEMILNGEVIHPDEDRYDMDDDEVMAAYQTAAPDGPDIDPMWEHVVCWEGSRGMLIAGLAQLTATIENTALGGDDDTFDYWPSGVRYAAAIADALDGDQWERDHAIHVEMVARRVIRLQRSQFAEELLDKCGYDPAIADPVTS
jgi:hypothetical protein